MKAFKENAMVEGMLAISIKLGVLGRGARWSSATR
jgi:hypothetical protein